MSSTSSRTTALSDEDPEKPIEVEGDEDLVTTSEVIEEAPPSNEQEEEDSSMILHDETTDLTHTKEKPRQWLIDRCDGTSKYNEDSRPPCCLCYVPFPVKWYPDILEQNSVCEWVGNLGCFDPENTKARKTFLGIALFTNISGLLFLVVAAFAITDQNFNILWKTSFSRIWLELLSGPEEYDTPTLYTMGLRAAAFESKVKNDSGVVSFDDFCDIEVVQTSQEMRTFVSTYQSKTRFDCDSCNDTSKKIVPSLFLSMLSYIPNFTTDVLRMWSNYDVNCQKFLASTFSWISLATAIYTWVNYRKDCFDSLDTEPFALNEDFEPVDMDSDDVFLVVFFTWEAGIGQICLALATFLKVVDIVCNFVLPTPTITRDHDEQEEYELRYGVGGDEGDEGELQCSDTHAASETCE